MQSVVTRKLASLSPSYYPCARSAPFNLLFTLPCALVFAALVSLAGAAHASAPSGTTPPSYEWGFLAYGERVYVDRFFTYTDVPGPYLGMDYLRTANDDKAGSDPAAVTFKVAEPVTVYVAYDERISARPAWLADWSDTGDALVTTPSATGRVDGADELRLYPGDTHVFPTVDHIGLAHHRDVFDVIDRWWS